MKVVPTALPGVVIIEPKVFEDGRGWFFESYHADRYAGAAGAKIPSQFVQDNHSCSAPGTLRGLHYQVKHPQGKLVRCVRGAIYDVAVDIRRGSPTFGKWVGIELSAQNRRQLYVPPGFAHGFCVPEVESEVEYKCTDFYHGDDESGVIWDDPTVGIAWPITEPIVSEKDARYSRLNADRPDLPVYQG